MGWPVGWPMGWPMGWPLGQSMGRSVYLSYPYCFVPNSEYSKGVEFSIAQWWGSARQRKREQRRQREIFKAAEAEGEATSGKMEAAEAEGEAIS